MLRNITFSIIAGLLFSFAIACITLAFLKNLKEMRLASAEQRLAAEDTKYAQITALARGLQDELAKRKDEVTNTYKRWHDINSVVESTNKANCIDHKAVEAAAQAYIKAYKAFIALQKDILIKANASIKEHVAHVVVMQ